MSKEQEIIEGLREEIQQLREKIANLEEEEERHAQTENALKESEELYRTLLDTSPDSVTVTDLEGNFIMVNQGAVELHGCETKEELFEKNAFDLIAPQDKERALENTKKTFESGGIRNVEYTLIKKDGTSFWAELSASLIKDSDGNPRALIGVVRDISERKRVEEALEEREVQYRMLIDTSPDSITMLDLQGNVIMANPATQELIGNVPIEQIIGKNIFDFISPEDKKKASKDIKEIMRTGHLNHVEYTIVRKTGLSYSIEVNVSLIKDSKDKPRAILAIARDITERKTIERALAEEKERLTVTLQSIAEAVITVDVTGRIIFLNAVAEQLTGCKQSDDVGAPLSEVLQVISNNKKLACDDLVHKVVETGDVYDILADSTLIAKDGSERMITQSCSPITDKDNKIIGVVLIIRDVTEKQKMEKELFKSKKLESIGTLAGGIAHDFNNILTGITSNLFMSKMSLGKDSESYNSIIEAEKAAFRASKLTNQLLTFAKGGEPIKESQSIGEIIEEAVGFSLSGSNVDCKLEIADDVWPLEIDRGQIDQVINNLIINADQAMPEGGTITVKAENVTIDEFASEGTNAYLPLDPGKYVRISVKDEGVSIPPEHIEKIYDPYFTTKENGTGLGLTICYSILKKHNGLIFVKSQEGYGTTFHIYLPATEKEVADVTVKKDVPMSGSGRVLVMDDEEVVRIAAGHVLKVIGYEVAFASDGTEAIEIYKQAFDEGKPFNALIMDLTIPGGMGGKEAIVKLKEIDPNVKGIVSSGYSTDPVMANYEDYGFCGVISKPYMVEDLNRILHEAIEEDTSSS